MSISEVEIESEKIALLKKHSHNILYIFLFLARRAIANPNDGFIQQLKIYEGMLTALRSRDNFLVPKSPQESLVHLDSDTDLVDFGFEIRVKKLVHDIHEREKANIRRCKSMNSKLRPRF